MRRRQLFILPILFILVLVFLSLSSSAQPVKNAKLEPRKLEAAQAEAETKQLEAAQSEAEAKKLEAAQSEAEAKKLEAAPPPKNGKPKKKDPVPRPPEKKPPPKANKKDEEDKPKDAPPPSKNPPPKDAPPGGKPNSEKKSPSPESKPKDRPPPGDPKPNEPPPPPLSPPPSSPPVSEEPGSMPAFIDDVGQAEAEPSSADTFDTEVTAGKSPQDIKQSSVKVLPIALGVFISLAALSLFCLFYCIIPRLQNRSLKMRRDGDEAALASSLAKFTARISPSVMGGQVKNIESSSDLRLSVASTLGGGAWGGYVMNKPLESSGLFDSSLYPDPPVLSPTIAAASKSSFGRMYLDADDDSYLTHIQPQQGSYKSSSLVHGAGGAIE